MTDQRLRLFGALLLVASATVVLLLMDRGPSRERTKEAPPTSSAVDDRRPSADLVDAERSPESGGGREHEPDETRPGTSHAAIVAWVTDIRGIGLAEVTVLVEDEGSPTLGEWKTGADGRISIDLGVRVAPGEPLTLRLQREGYRTEELAVRAGETVRIALHRLPRVTVRLQDDDGRVVSGPAEFRIEVHPEEAEPWTASARSDAAGEHVFSSVPPGRMVGVTARARGYRETADHGERRLLLDVDTDVVLRLSDDAVIEGVVRDSVTQEPLAGALVWAEAPDYSAGSSLPATVADGHGRFSLRGVSPWDERIVDGQLFTVFYLQASADGYSSDLRRATRLPRQPPGGVYPCDILLDPRTAVFRGRLVAPDGVTPVASAWIVAIDALAESHRTRSNEDGRFLLDDLPFEPLPILAWKTADGGEERDGSVSLFVNAEISPTAAAAPDRDIRMAECAGTEVRGTARGMDGVPVSSARMHAVLHFEGKGVRTTVESFEALTDSHGRFEFLELIPGSYEFRAEHDSLPCSTPRRLQLVLEPSSPTVADFLLGPCARFAGRVPVGVADDVRVVLIEPDSAVEFEVAPVAPDGSFAFAPLLADQYRLELRVGREVLATLLVGPDTDEEILLQGRR